LKKCTVISLLSELKNNNFFIVVYQSAEMSSTDKHVIFVIEKCSFVLAEYLISFKIELDSRH
jgi:hypothetical protein